MGWALCRALDMAASLKGAKRGEQWGLGEDAEDGAALLAMALMRGYGASGPSDLARLTGCSVSACSKALKNPHDGTTARFGGMLVEGLVEEARSVGNEAGLGAFVRIIDARLPADAALASMELVSATKARKSVLAEELADMFPLLSCEQMEILHSLATSMIETSGRYEYERETLAELRRAETLIWAANRR